MISTKTAISWKTPDIVMEDIAERNKKLRIIGDSLYVRTTGAAEIRCFEVEEKRWVFVSKRDWLKASPAIKRIEACVLLRMTHETFDTRRAEEGIEGKRGVVGFTEPGIPRIARGLAKFYSVADLVRIARETPYHSHGRSNVASSDEIRKLFSEGFISYKRLRNGSFVPLWEETV